MKKHIISLTAAVALLCTPFVYAEDDPNGRGAGQATQQTTSSNTKYVDVQLKTADGKVWDVKIDPSDLQGLKAGSKVEIIAEDSNKTEELFFVEP